MAAARENQDLQKRPNTLSSVVDVLVSAAFGGGAWDSNIEHELRKPGAKADQVGRDLAAALWKLLWRPLSAALSDSGGNQELQEAIRTTLRATLWSRFMTAAKTVAAGKHRVR